MRCVQPAEVPGVLCGPQEVRDAENNGLLEYIEGLYDAAHLHGVDGAERHPSDFIGWGGEDEKVWVPRWERGRLQGGGGHHKARAITGVDARKRQRLREMKVFVLDNSMRESTVGQTTGHTLNDKHQIIEEVHKCKFDHAVVAAFSHQRRVDDAYCETLTSSYSAEHVSTMYAFTEDADSVVVTNRFEPKTFPPS